MSSAVVSTSAALGRLFHFDADSDSNIGITAQACTELVEENTPVERNAAAIQQHLQSAIHHKKIPPASITPASRLEVRPMPPMASSGISAIDTLTGGLPRGCLTEIFGPVSSGRTSVLLAALAAATSRGEFCAVVDACDALDPHSVAAAGVDLERLLWVRCGEESPQNSRSKQTGGPALPGFRRVGASSQAAFSFTHAPQKKIEAEDTSRQSEHRLEQVLRATDLLLESGGFGLIILDLSDLPPQSARRIPLTTWFRFRRAVEHKPTILLSIEQQPIAGSCSSLLLQLGSQSLSEKKMDEEQFSSSRKAAALVNPGRKSWVETKKKNESRRDGTELLEWDTSRDPYPHAQSVHPTHTQLLTGLHINAELILSRLERKPASSITFATKTAWAG